MPDTLDSALFQAPESPYRVPFDGSFSRADYPTAPPGDAADKEAIKSALAEIREALDDLQRRLHASGRWSVLLIFQAMDAAGKDSTIRSVMRGVDPVGCHVHSFKQPSSRERDHDFLWRTQAHLPRKGHIGIFNRSYYEEMLITRVHPEYLDAQRLPVGPPALWQARREAIIAHERHLAVSGTVVMKFWLNVSRETQRMRFLRRLEKPDKRWKFSLGDVRERGFWPQYMDAYEEAVGLTSRPWAPWYAIPADDKPYMRERVGDIIRRALESLDLRYPQPDPAIQDQQQAIRDGLQPDS